MASKASNEPRALQVALACVLTVRFMVTDGCEHPHRERILFAAFLVWVAGVGLVVLSSKRAQPRRPVFVAAGIGAVFLPMGGCAQMIQPVAEPVRLEDDLTNNLMTWSNDTLRLFLPAWGVDGAGIECVIDDLGMAQADSIGSRAVLASAQRCGFGDASREFCNYRQPSN